MNKSARHTLRTAAMACMGALLLLAGSGCSNIAEDERLIYVEPVVAPDTTGTVAPDSLWDAPITSVPRRVLVEDHTGQHCPNCPDANNLIHEFLKTYGSRVVPVAIHSEVQGIREPEGLGPELGNTYYRHWNLQFKPAGLISRVDGGDGAVLDKTLWNLALNYVLTMETPLDIRVRASLPATNAHTADIDVKVICTKQDASVSGKLQVWVTEDSIIAVQDSMGTRVDRYRHDHVLRASANGTWGQDVSVSGSEDDNIREFHYTLPLGAAWKPENLTVVAFVYTGDEVVQAAQAKLKLTE